VAGWNKIYCYLIDNFRTKNMAEKKSDNKKKEILRDIIINLHRGTPVEEAKERFLKEVGNISSTEIAELEQGLIEDGLSVDEIKKFCNVHALLFESALRKDIAKEESPTHPVYLFKQENREIEKLASRLEDLCSRRGDYTVYLFKKESKGLLEMLCDVDIHYTRKEQVLFPFLERHEFFGPSQVMWGKDDEIRDMLKDALLRVDGLQDEESVAGFIKKNIEPLVEEVLGMVFKEEQILFPAALEKLSVDEWTEVFSSSEEVGYCYIEKPIEDKLLSDQLKKSYREEPLVKDSENIVLPTGALSLKELEQIFNRLPVDITFVDKDDRVKYFSDNPGRIFVRTRSVVGRKVQNCHPPQSVEIVEGILDSFKNGSRDTADFWINLKGKMLFIRYFALRDTDGKYLGTLEVTQDITDIKKIEGERRLLDEG